MKEISYNGFKYCIPEDKNWCVRFSNREQLYNLIELFKLEKYHFGTGKEYNPDDIKNGTGYKGYLSIDKCDNFTYVCIGVGYKDSEYKYSDIIKTPNEY